MFKRHYIPAYILLFVVLSVWFYGQMTAFYKEDTTTHKINDLKGIFGFHLGDRLETGDKNNLKIVGEDLYRPRFKVSDRGVFKTFNEYLFASRIEIKPLDEVKHPSAIELSTNQADQIVRISKTLYTEDIMMCRGSSFMFDHYYAEQRFNAQLLAISTDKKGDQALYQLRGRNQFLSVSCKLESEVDHALLKKFPYRLEISLSTTRPT